jgi:hypothetical protein
MISTTEFGRWFNRGVLDFMNRNADSLGAVRVYVSPSECECLVCLAIVGDNPYTPDEANTLGIPAHPRCVHYLSIVVEQGNVGASATLWAAQLDEAA